MPEVSAQTTLSREDVAAAMRRATEFMFGLAHRGGFVWLYVADTLEPYGELKARPSMVWVEPPSTPSVGIMLLKAYEATKDRYYLGRARDVAGALAAGQYPSGGWNYFIDFDPDGLPQYYEDFFSKCWGWQEYLKKRDNCTFDDYSTTEPTRFMLRLYALTQDPAHGAVLRKALDHVLRAQYPNGGWPQRFPLDGEHPDYTACVTFNDDVALDCILVLLEAHETLQENQYLRAARKGMDFYLRAQLAPPQAGWAQQYDADLQPAWGRPFEIGTVSAVQTHQNILDLFQFFKLTGDAKYLAPIPGALAWLERARIPNNEQFTHTCFYEMGSNRPVYIRQTGTTVHDVRYELTYTEEGCYPYAPRVSVPLEFLRGELARLESLAPGQARAEHDQERKQAALPEFKRGLYLVLALGKTEQSAEGVAAIVQGLDARGGWPDEVSLLDPFQPFTKPARTVTAYTTGGYLARMYRLINSLNVS
ncbi:MAG: hypothetical protein HYV26_24140 [Candidatus Hydrogenedentes bacterium]|nr:hypothetical protein [Candidatus Hydrogenedentota bacterium]